MDTVARIRSFAAKAAPDFASRPGVEVPSWLLMPGLIAFGVSLVAYAQLVRAYPQGGWDLSMYRSALHAFIDGKPVYQHGFGPGGLPYTYPPVTLPVLLPLILTKSLYTIHQAWTALEIVATLLILWCTTRMLGYRGTAGRMGIVLLAASLLLWTEPFWWNFELGQINPLIILPIVIDLSLSNRSRYKGVGIGIATASKLLPGLFIVYLLATRRVRAAIVSVATFVGLTAVGAIIQPGGSYDYWIRGLAFDSHRVLGPGGPRYVGNQSLQGFITRVLHSDQQNSIPWIIADLLVLVGGLAVAVRANRRGEEVMGMVIVGFTALLISPVTWSHYWLWIAPTLLLLVDVARRTTGPARHVAILVAFLATAPFLMYPVRLFGGLKPNGLIWVSMAYHGVVGAAFSDPYVPTALVMFVVAALWLRTRPILPPDAPLDTNTGTRGLDPPPERIEAVPDAVAAR